MIPCNPMNNSQHCPFGNSKFFGKSICADLSWGICRSNKQYISVSEFCVGALRALHAWSKALPSFGDFIKRIVSTRSDEQVVRINAWRVITLMQDAIAMRYFSCMNLIANSMRQQQFSLSSTKLKDPIPKLYVFTSFPYPAFIRYRNSVVKHFFNIAAWSFHGVEVYRPVINYSSEVAIVGQHHFFIPKPRTTTVKV